MLQAGPAIDIITPHITDAHAIDYPCLHPGFVCELALPRWAPIHLGPISIDMSPTKHVVWLGIAAVLCLVTMLMAARAHARTTFGGSRAPSGFGNGMEAFVLFLRNEVVIPYGSTATGNIAVTATLAVITFVVVEIAGMREQGAGYINTIVYWPHDVPVPVKSFMTLIMTPVEIVGKITKPFALAIRLFANMTAGHVVLLALIGLIFTFKSYIVAPAPIAMAVAISLLEIFVSL